MRLNVKFKLKGHVQLLFIWRLQVSKNVVDRGTGGTELQESFSEITKFSQYGGNSNLSSLAGFIVLQDLKNIKNVKGCRDGMPKSMQTR